MKFRVKIWKLNIELLDKIESLIKFLYFYIFFENDKVRFSKFNFLFILSIEK